VNSYISNSDSHRRFVLWLFVLVLVPVAGLFTLGVYLQPLFGDLTRIGSYAEKDFGWNKPQLQFNQPLSENGRYERYYDVVVLGDSFSTGRTNLHWQNYLVAAKGWSVVTLNINKISLEQVLENPVFRKTPPKFFILGTVERELPRRMKKHVQPCDQSALLKKVGVSAEAPPAPTVYATQLQSLAKYVERETAWRDIKLGYVKDYIWNSFQRTLLGDAHTDAAKVELAQKAPFSSVQKSAMLVYKDDFRKVSWWREMGLPEISCRIEMINKRIEANGQTRFALMIAPDKLTAYSGYLRDKKLRDISALAELSGKLPKVIPRIDLALNSAIDKGEQDIYLPDDTHWGSSGYQIAAETLLTFLREPKQP
jgi:hypothetical protein